MNVKTEKPTTNVFYISDIHILDKLLAAFPANATNAELAKWIRDYIREMLVKTTTQRNTGDILLVGGDVSSIFDITAVFYTELAKAWPPENIVAVLGNHELWHLGRSSNVDEVISDHRALFNHLGVHFLENELLIVNDNQSRIVSESDLLTLAESDLQAMCQDSRLLVLGGVGFSGCNPGFNATNGLYRGTIPTLAADQERSGRFNAVHARMRSVLTDSMLVVFTHTPKTDWTTDDYVRSFVYVSGHTHRNVRIENTKRVVYADNQVGYYGKTRGLKHFQVGQV